ncbi:MAG: hypothetical protein J5U17_08435 [Candidatus Methanoperedens sp.]|nr:hypothetical protein [Candidatus Methanoperedens sp.]MCE8425788.1 hypothetical protein [Candidatus Methanoperedens sp.]MCE8428145.1 hypothetical protein [Candidatus Methanoperedens sp.]
MKIVLCDCHLDWYVAKVRSSDDGGTPCSAFNFYLTLAVKPASRRRTINNHNNMEEKNNE